MALGRFSTFIVGLRRDEEFRRIRNLDGTFGVVSSHPKSVLPTQSSPFS